MNDQEFFNHFKNMKNHSKVIRSLKDIKNEISKERVGAKKARIQACANQFLEKIPELVTKKLNVYFETSMIIKNHSHTFRFGVESVTISRYGSKFKYVHKLKDIDTFDLNQIVTNLGNLELTNAVVNS